MWLRPLKEEPSFHLNSTPLLTTPATVIDVIRVRTLNLNALFVEQLHAVSIDLVIPGAVCSQLREEFC